MSEGLPHASRGLLRDVVVIAWQELVDSLRSRRAWVILLLAGGLLERDGVFIFVGYVVFVLGVLYFVFLGEAATQLVQALVHWLRT